jgi:predicted transcriptional regulator
MEERSELLFLLSSADRMNLLLALSKERLKLSRLSTKTSMTVQETSRQLVRLQAGKLVERDREGLFTLTGFGSTTLELLPAFDFLSLRRDYLVSHDLASLPKEFRERLGELAEHEFADKLGGVLTHFEEVLSQAHEYIWLMADQILLQDSLTERVSAADGLSIRILIPAAAVKNADYASLPGDVRGRVEVGLADQVKVGMALNEKLAGVAFADRTGRVDFSSGLRGHDPSFHGWCRDLFQSQWSRTRKIF